MPFSIRAAALSMPLLAAGCGPHTGLDSRAAVGACGMQDMQHYAAAHVVMNAATPVSKDVMSSWADGCAVISFSIDKAGRMQSPAVVNEMPAGTGVAAQSIAYLQRDIYAPGRVTTAEQPFVAPDPSTRFSIEVGFAKNGRNWNVVKRFGLGKLTTQRAAVSGT